MKVVWNDQVIAEAEKKDLIRIEGNWYFPKSALKQEFFTPSETHTVCPWKGTASYFNVQVGESANDDAAWYYPEPKAGSIERVGKDFTNFVAFWRGVEVSE